jgi:uncharacterized protein YbjT (DUF2867 family)
MFAPSINCATPPNFGKVVTITRPQVFVTGPQACIIDHAIPWPTFPWTEPPAPPPPAPAPIFIAQAPAISPELARVIESALAKEAERLRGDNERLERENAELRAKLTRIAEAAR